LTAAKLRNKKVIIKNCEQILQLYYGGCKAHAWLLISGIIESVQICYILLVNSNNLSPILTSFRDIMWLPGTFIHPSPFNPIPGKFPLDKTAILGAPKSEDYKLSINYDTTTNQHTDRQPEDIC